MGREGRERTRGQQFIKVGGVGQQQRYRGGGEMWSADGGKKCGAEAKEEVRERVEITAVMVVRWEAGAELIGAAECPPLLASQLARRPPRRCASEDRGG